MFFFPPLLKLSFGRDFNEAYLGAHGIGPIPGFAVTIKTFKITII
jgi:hypothetical protein